MRLTKLVDRLIELIAEGHADAQVWAVTPKGGLVLIENAIVDKDGEIELNDGSPT